MFGIDLTGQRKPLSLAAVPQDLLKAPDRDAGLPRIRLEDGTTALNIHLLGYHKGIGRQVHLYVNHLQKGQE